MSSPPANSAWLIPLPGGPPIKALQLSPNHSKGRGLLIGRGEACELRLEDPKVSRPHAQLTEDAGRWRIADQHSRWGTFVNGQKLEPGSWFPIAEGDQIQIKPWTFMFSARGVPQERLRAIDDIGATAIRTLSGIPVQPLREELLSVLLEGSSLIQAAKDEKILFESLMEIASRGAGLPNAAVVRVLDSTGGIEVAAQRCGRVGANHPLTFSRSLLAAAAGGDVAELSISSQDNVSHSLIESNVQAAICAPLMVGTTVAAYLYLDSRGSPSGGFRTLRDNAAAFCQALARMGGLALANLKRMETEVRVARMDAELEAAAGMQRMILPRGVISSGSLTCFGVSRPSSHLGGDFFDAIPLAGERLVVTLGDVSGHGAQASVLMTAIQGFLRAAFRYHHDVARAVTDLNAFLHTRCPGDKFITLWIGLFDQTRKELSYVDAGHGLALLLTSGGGFQPLDANDGQALNIIPDFSYNTTAEHLRPNDRLLIISDGIKEQPQPQSGQAAGRIEFGLERVKTIAAAEGNDALVEKLFDALYEFAGTKDLADDATAVLVRWS